MHRLCWGTGRLITYPIGTSGQQLVLTDVAAHHLYAHRQRTWRDLEAGGQLFARFKHATILVERITGPRRSDQRHRTTFIPDRQAERGEIQRLFRQDLHYIGDWHTHPERHPAPSSIDLVNFAEMVRCSHHHLNGLVMIVVGMFGPPCGLNVSICNGHNFYTLETA